MNQVSQDQPFRSFALLIYNSIIKPRLVSEDLKRIELILNILLVSTIVFSFVLFLIGSYSRILHGSEFTGILPAALFTWFIEFVILLKLSRSGYVTTSSYGLIVLLFLPTTYSMVKYGAVIPQLILMQAMLIIISSVLLGTRVSFIFTGIVGVVTVCIHYLHQANIIVPTDDWRQSEINVFIDILPLVVTLFVIAIVSWLSNREIEKSLCRARQSEADLKKERDTLEDKVEERTRELKQAQMEQMSQLYRFAEFGKMSSGYFHDIANPLTAVSLSLERLKDQGYQKLADTRIHFERALSAAKRMEGYIAAIKKQLQQQEELTVFSPSLEVEQLIEILGYKARKAGVTIRSRLDSQIQLFGNPLKFNQIVMNLVSNAIDSYEGAEVLMEDREVIVILRREGSYVELTVKDYGSGIQRDHLVRIFEPFFTTKSARHGVGIGLATVKDIVKKDFAGSIRVESKLGKGSEFTAFFPVKVARPRTPEHGGTNQ